MRLHDPVKIEVTHLGHPVDELESAPNLFDSVGTGLPLIPSLLEANPELWALVHNGIRHSVAHDAEIDHRTRDARPTRRQTRPARSAHRSDQHLRRNRSPPLIR